MWLLGIRVPSETLPAYPLPLLLIRHTTLRAVPPHTTATPGATACTHTGMCLSLCIEGLTLTLVVGHMGASSSRVACLQLSPSRTFLGLLYRISAQSPLGLWTCCGASAGLPAHSAISSRNTIVFGPGSDTTTFL